MNWKDIKKGQTWINKQTGNSSHIEVEPKELLDYARLLHSTGKRTLIRPGLLLVRYNHEARIGSVDAAHAISTYGTEQLEG